MPDLPRAEIGEPAGIKPRSFFERVWVAALYGIAVLVALWFGPVSDGVLFGVMAGLAAAEFYALERREARLPNELFGVACRGAHAARRRLLGLVRALGVRSHRAHRCVARRGTPSFVRALTADTADHRVRRALHGLPARVPRADPA